MNQWLDSANSELKLILHTKAEGQDAEALRDPPPKTIDLLIGPEGGFSDAEADAATTAGFNALQLGPRILRTETAPLAALAALQAKWGDLGLA